MYGRALPQKLSKAPDEVAIPCSRHSESNAVKETRIASQIPSKNLLFEMDG